MSLTLSCILLGIFNTFSFEHEIVCMDIALNFITLELISEHSGRHWLGLLTSEQLVLCLTIFLNDFFYSGLFDHLYHLSSVGICVDLCWTSVVLVFLNKFHDLVIPDNTLLPSFLLESTLATISLQMSI